MTVRRFIKQHGNLLKRLDSWFRSVQAKYADQMRCGPGCARCCHGLFDISLADAVHVVEGFRALPEELREAVLRRSLDIHSKIVRELPELKAPYLLIDVPEDRIDLIAERMTDIRCPFLTERDSCLVYDFRPLACRLEGLPMVDDHDGLFGDWCELNFKMGLSPELAQNLRLDYYEIQDIELRVTAYLSQCLGAGAEREATLFIPSVIAAIEAFLTLDFGSSESSD